MARLHWMTQVLLYTLLLRLCADIVLVAGQTQRALAAADSAVNLQSTLSVSPWIVAFGSLFANAGETLAYMAAAAMVETLYRIWRQLQLQNASHGEPA